MHSFYWTKHVGKTVLGNGQRMVMTRMVTTTRIKQDAVSCPWLCCHFRTQKHSWVDLEFLTWWKMHTTEGKTDAEPSHFHGDLASESVAETWTTWWAQVLIWENLFLPLLQGQCCWEDMLLFVLQVLWCRWHSRRSWTTGEQGDASSGVWFTVFGGWYVFQGWAWAGIRGDLTCR
jgi:hypothetical protein